MEFRELLSFQYHGTIKFADPAKERVTVTSVLSRGSGNTRKVFEYLGK